MSHDEIEKFTSIAVLHDHIKLLFCLNDFIKLDDVRVADFLENFYFSCDSFNVFLVVNFVFFKDFYSNL